jgi:hypothetical protein
MELTEILRRLDEVAKKKKGIIRDGMKAGMTHLVIFSDGSGAVQAEWSEYNEGMCKEEKLLRQILSEESPIFEFDKVGELEAWLVEQSGGD